MEPLRRGIKLILPGSNDLIWIPPRYEKLWDFCYYCGCVDHIVKDCLSRFKVKETNDVSVYQYGLMLRVAQEARKNNVGIEHGRSSTGRSSSNEYDSSGLRPKCLVLGLVNSPTSLVFSPVVGKSKEAQRGKDGKAKFVAKSRIKHRLKR